ncbi:hypothetical protein QYE76_046991 [Lolium multiflorum]|uniref:Uncharacterized protein n=1 Tax=Lolium multiflorum TaxID=4521 RepID=A0AAD8TQL7_LOLMU|nr:hypothetical protein QYE76_054243 [Lolium multiflorum]KAK1686143.1 hypothetical protein QYE76_046991 [Lolium multiflorum]
MDCVGLRPGFSLVENAVALYWDRSKRARAVEFVRDVLRRGSVGAGADYDGETGGPVGYLAWKMMRAEEAAEYYAKNKDEIAQPIRPARKLKNQSAMLDIDKNMVCGTPTNWESPNRAYHLQQQVRRRKIQEE